MIASDPATFIKVKSLEHLWERSADLYPTGLRLGHRRQQAVNLELTLWPWIKLEPLHILILFIKKTLHAALVSAVISRDTTVRRARTHPCLPQSGSSSFTLRHIFCVCKALYGCRYEHGNAYSHKSLAQWRVFWRSGQISKTSLHWFTRR